MLRTANLFAGKAGEAMTDNATTETKARKEAERAVWLQIAEDARKAEERAHRRGRDPHRGMVQGALPMTESDSREKGR